jgi:hypothetical protein
MPIIKNSEFDSNAVESVKVRFISGRLAIEPENMNLAITLGTYC